MVIATKTQSVTANPCGRCGHGASFHRHNDDLLEADCHGPDGNYACEHFRCLFPWQPIDRSPRPECACPHFVRETEGERGGS